MITFFVTWLIIAIIITALTYFCSDWMNIIFSKRTNFIRIILALPIYAPLYAYIFFLIRDENIKKLK